MTLPLVSIVIPTVNRPRRLEQAIISVATQTYPAIEIVVANDGGPSVQALVESAVGGRPFIYVEQTPGRGAGAARNLGLRAATGQWMGYLDDDDYYLPHHVETLASTLTAHPEWGAVYAVAEQVELWEENGQHREVARRLSYQENFSRAKLLIQNYIPNLCLMHRRSLLEQSGGFDESLPAMEDWDFLIRLSFAADFGYVPQVTAGFTTVRNGPHRDRWDGKRAQIIRHIYDRYAPHTPPAIQKLQQEMMLRYEYKAAQAEKTAGASGPG